MKHKFRRLMAMVLTLSMVTSMVGVMPVFAEEGDSSYWQIAGSSVTDHKEAVGDAENYNSYIVNKETASDDTTIDDVTKANSAVTTAENGKVTASKTIEGTENENEFVITLKVETLQELEKLNISADAAVVLVIDNSSSMYQNTADSLNGGKGNSTKLVSLGDKKSVNGGDYVELPSDVSEDYYEYVTGAIEYEGNKYIPYIQNARIPFKGNDIDDWRITQAKKAAYDFADSFLNDDTTTGKRYISVVSFSESAKNETDPYWSSDYNTVYDAIDAMRPINMTNMAPGLNEALDLLDDDPVADFQYKYVILLADGAASDEIASKSAATRVNNNPNTDLYTVSFAAANAMNGYAGTQMTAANSAELINSLADIQQDIETATQAFVITDPMGQNIIFDDNHNMINCQDKTDATKPSFQETENGFTWDLKLVVPDVQSVSAGGNTTTKKYVYTMTYDITLDTDAGTFEPNTYYLTNGHTHMPYAITTTNSATAASKYITGSIDFNVPAVKGEYPPYQYTVKHVLWDGTNVIETLDNEGPTTVKKKDVVNENYNDYSNRYYENDTWTGKGNTTDTLGNITITQDGQEIIFYYKPETVNVVVNHKYFEISAAGAEQSRDQVGATDTRTSPANLGEEFTAGLIPGGYTLEKVYYGDDLTTNLFEDADTPYSFIVGRETPNEVTYEYVKLADNEAYTDVIVNHHYHAYKYTTEDTGKLHIVPDLDNQLADDQDKYDDDDYLVGQAFTAIPKPEGYELVTDKNVATMNWETASDALTILSLAADNNVIDLHYETVAENPYQDTDMEVIHMYYTTERIVNANGDLVWDTPVLVSGETSGYNTANESYTGDPVYAGETYTIDPEMKGYDGYFVEGDKNNGYLTETAPNNTITLVANADKNVVTIKYIKQIDELEPTDVTVYHYYTYVYEVMDNNGSIHEEYAYYGPEGVTFDTHRDDSTAKLYPNQSYRAAVVTDIGDGHAYEYNTLGEDYSGVTNTPDRTIKLTAATNVIHLNYYAFESLSDQGEDDAMVVVHHHYTDIVKTYDGTGTLEDVLNVSSGANAKVVKEFGGAGDSFTADSIIDVSDVETFYNANLGIYEGRDEWQEEYDLLTEEITETFTRGDVKHIYLDYQRVIEVKDPTTVDVIHNYYDTVIYIDEDGNKQEVLNAKPTYFTEDLDITVNANGDTLYAGMNYHEELENKDGYTVEDHAVQDIAKLDADGSKNVITINYYGTDNRLVDTSVVVTLHYKTTTYTMVDGVRTPNVEEHSTSVSVPEKVYYAGQYYTADGEQLDYDYIKCEGSSDITKVEDTYKIKLAAGENTIDVFYEREFDKTVQTALFVNHEYYVKSMVTGEETLIDAHTKHYFHTGFVEELRTITPEWVGDFALENVTASNDSLVTYTTIDEATGEEVVDYYTMVLENERNEVTIKYVYVQDDFTYLTVNVRHQYHTYNRATGLVSDDGFTDNVPVTLRYEETDGTYSITDDDLIFDFKDNTYRYESGEMTITLVKDGDNQIIIDYERVIGSSPEEPDEPDEPDEPKVPDEPDVPEVPDEPEDPTTDIPEVDPPLTEIPDEPDVPTTDIPEIEIPEIEIPLTDVPQTGDTRNIALYAAIAMMSALGLAWLTKTEYDEKKRTEN